MTRAYQRRRIYGPGPHYWDKDGHKVAWFYKARARKILERMEA